MEVAEVTWPVKLEALWDVVPLYWLLWKGHWCTHLISPFLLYAILFCTYGILLNPFRYFTNMSDILQKNNICFTDIIWIVYTYFSNIEKKFVAYLSLLIFKKKQDKNGVLHILFAPHAKLHTEKPLWLSIIGHLLGVITRIFVLYESDFWLRIIWKINKTSEWGKGKL